MVQFSSEVLDRFGAPELSLFTECGAKELPLFPDYLSNAVGDYIRGVRHPDDAVAHLDLAILRRAVAAADEYSMARADLLRFVEGLASGRHRLGVYLSSLRHLEQCIGAVCQAGGLFDQMQHRAQGLPFNGPTLYPRGDKKSDLARINSLNNVIKHFSAQQAEQTSAPIWITNAGLKSAEAFLSFDELHENIVALFEVARQIFEELPRAAAARKAAKGSSG